MTQWTRLSAEVGKCSNRSGKIGFVVWIIYTVTINAREWIAVMAGWCSCRGRESDMSCGMAVSFAMDGTGTDGSIRGCHIHLSGVSWLWSLGSCAICWVTSDLSAGV